MEPEELAGALKRLADWATEHAPQRESPMRRLLREHFGADPIDRGLPDPIRPMGPSQCPAKARTIALSAR